MEFVRSIYFTRRWWLAIVSVVGCFVLGHFYELCFTLAQLGLLAMVLLLALDLYLLYQKRQGIIARRETPERLSNGDENIIYLLLENHYAFPVALHIIDEIPQQFNLRDFALDFTLAPGEKQTASYALRPVARGEYHFGCLNVYAAGPINLAQRRYRLEQDAVVPVYPSFLQMRRYELRAIFNRLTEVGLKKVRRLGHTMEFDRIRAYVAGDDYRTMNWKATARRTELMVNSFEDEKAQQVYCAIDMGRVMKAPFAGMSLLDYAINAALVIANIAIRKQDKAGLITFSHQLEALLPADRRHTQMGRIMDVLYNQSTLYLESGYEQLHAAVFRHIKQRSLIILYTNFETLSGLTRQLPYLRRLARRHLLVIVFFQNTELQSLLEHPAATTEEIYIKTVAEQLDFEKRQIVKELERYGMHPVLTTPQGLTVAAINKYLELKARNLI